MLRPAAEVPSYRDGIVGDSFALLSLADRHALASTAGIVFAVG
jgi:hypothetical protein